jgi:hypothetical protein
MNSEIYELMTEILDHWHMLFFKIIGYIALNGRITVSDKLEEVNGNNHGLF